MAEKTSGWGIYGDVLRQIDPTHKAARVSLRPPEKGVFGSYSAVFATGAFVAGALVAQVISTFRWNVPGISAILRRVWGGISVTTAFAQGDVSIDLIKGSGVAAQYTGGAVFSLAGKSGVRSSRMTASQQQIANSAVGNIAIANGGALVAPTPAWNFDNQPFARYGNSLTTGLPLGLIYEARAFDEPIELQMGEGVAARVNWPATGVVNPAIIIYEWDEVDPARYFC